MADAAVWITGTGQNKQLNFRLPTGGKGDKGDKGDKGADGSNVLPTDTAIAAAVNGNGATRTALNATIDTKVAPAVAKGVTAPAPPRPAQPVVSFTFDDGPAQDMSVVKPILDAKGIKGSFALNSTTVGTAGALSWAQARQLRDEGHEIIDHSSSHVDLNTTNAATIKAEVDDSYARFVANGVTPEGFCWPFSLSSVTSRRAVRKFYRYALGGSGGTTQPLHTYAIKRVVLGNSTALATHQAQIDAAVTNNEFLIFLIHAGYDLNASSQTMLGQVIDYAKASAAKVLTTGQGFDLIGNVLDTGDLPSATSYTVVSGAGKLFSSDVTPVVIYGGGYALSATAGPATFPAGKVQYFTLNAPGNTDWPVAGQAGTVITDRTDATNALFVTQQFISAAGVVYTRRGSTNTTWGAWSSTAGAAAPVAVVGTFNKAASAGPDQYEVGKIAYHAVNAPGNTDWPVTGVAGNVMTNRATDSSWAFAYQQFIPYSGDIYTRYGASATTWTAWKKSSAA